MIKELVYLGVPYTGTKEEMNFRAMVVDTIARDLSYKGIMVYSPISSWHHVSCNYNMPTNYSFWQDMCESFLSRCSKLMVVKLPGWTTSIGLQSEIKFAKENNIAIEYINPNSFILQVGMVMVYPEGEL